MVSTAQRRYLSLREVAMLYGISERTVRRAIAAGRLPAVRVGGQVRIHVDQAERLARPITTVAGAR